MYSAPQPQMHGLAECPHCQDSLEAPLAAAGRVARCSSCDRRFELPDAESLFTNAAAFLLEHDTDVLDLDPAPSRRLRFPA